MRRELFVILSLWMAGPAWGTAPQCADPQNPSVPLCPTTGILSEQYPVAAVTVSDIGGEARFATEYLTAVFRAQGDPLPQAYLMVKDENFEEIKRRLRANAPSPEVADRWIRNLHRPPGVRRYNWQQDYFEAFHDPATGRPQLRRIAQYPSRVMPEENFDNLVRALNQNCGETAGPPISHSGPAVNGISGGNLEAASDFCIVGRDAFASDDYFREYARSVCGSLDNLIEAPTQFLAAGHTDEIYKTIPIPGRQPPCNFAIAIASTRKAFELLDAQPTAPAFSRQPEDMERSGTYRSLCRAYEDLGPQRRNRGNGGPSEGQSLWRLIAPDLAVANMVDHERCAAGMTSRNLADIVRGDPNLGPLNREIQQRMDEFVATFKARVARRYPGCEPPVIESPQLFWGGGEFSSAQAKSIFPNPTNGEYVNGQYLMPDPVNNLFGDAFRSQLSGLGIGQTVINTDFAHRLTGNLHCSTHAIRYCRPRGRTGR